MSSKRECATSDAWTVAKSKLAFVAAVCELEAEHVSEINCPFEGLHADKDALWGRHFVLQEIYDQMDEAIEGELQQPSVKEVVND